MELSAASLNYKGMHTPIDDTLNEIRGWARNKLRQRESAPEQRKIRHLLEAIDELEEEDDADDNDSVTAEAESSDSAPARKIVDPRIYHSDYLG
ncbi:MAG: hypothetical protein ABL889_00555 [Terricaulis sp.]